MRRAERLFRLIGELRARGGGRASDLAAALEVSERTIYRDVAHLQASGVPIDGEAGVGYLLRPGFDLPAMTFTFEQIEAVALGLAFVEVAGDAALADAAREVRAKLQVSLPSPARRDLDRQPLFALRRDGPAGNEATRVRRAIRDARVLLLDYRDADGTQTRRRVWPLALWVTDDGWVVAGWCELRHDFRAFRTDRIVALADTGDRFESRPGRDLPAFAAAKGLDLDAAVARALL